ncbi:hypothetical protein IAU60_003200 [Kwoniella sp. DSM 27419]
MTPEAEPDELENPKPSVLTPDHSMIRLWFLNNISYPYPTNPIKEQLAEAAGITRAKVDSDLTNFRRRSGWTDLLNKHAGGDRDKMRRLVDRVLHGRESKQDVLDRVAGIQEYLGRKEEERVGDWVKEVAALAPFAPKDTDSEPVTPLFSKVRPVTSLSSLSAVSTALRPETPRSSSGSSTVSTSSSATDASLTMPFKGKRLNPFAPEFIPHKRISSRVISTSTQASSSSEVSEQIREPLWIDAGRSHVVFHPGQPSPVPSPRPTYQVGSPDQMAANIWSTTRSLPSLPHMSQRSERWVRPTQSGFAPSLDGWMSEYDGSVSGISRAV